MKTPRKMFALVERRGRYANQRRAPTVHCQSRLRHLRLESAVLTFYALVHTKNGDEDTMKSNVWTAHHPTRSVGPAVSVALALGLALLAMPGCGNDNGPSSPSTQVTINEAQSKNATIVSDTGQKSDWVELYNPGTGEEKLAGFFISDDPAKPQKAILPSQALIPPKGYLVLWLDDTNSSATPLHFPFKLSGKGDNFLLSAPNGTILKQLPIPADPTGEDTTLPDESYAAYPDGSGSYHWTVMPTPGSTNSAQ
jgi:hypothetical protein